MPFLYQVHSVAAMLYFLFLPLAPAPRSITWVVLLVAFLIRLPWLIKLSLPLLLQPLAWILFLFALWTGLSLSWSVDPAVGFRHWETTRLLITPLLLWSVLDRLPWMIICFLIGLAAQNVLQIIDITELASISPADESHRAGGLLHPTLTGGFCVTALCWYASAFLNGSRTWMVVAIVGGLLAAIGLVISGSRGGWVAGFVAVVLMFIISMARFPQVRRRGLISLILVVLFFLASWPFTGSMIRTGFTRATNEIQMVNDDQKYDTSAGLRILLWRWAGRAFVSHPMTGIGMGGFEDFAVEQPEYVHALEDNPRTADYMRRDHAHSVYLQLLATTGIIGLILFVAALLLMLYQAWFDPPNHVFAIGSFFAIVGWCVSAQFDCLIYSGGLVGLLMILVAATMPYRSRLRLVIQGHDVASLETISEDKVNS